MYQRWAASSSGSAAIAASAWPTAAGASPVASAASAAISRARRSSRLSSSRAGSAQAAYGSSASAVPADSSPSARSAAARATAAAVRTVCSACWQYRGRGIEIDADAGPGGQPVALPAALDDAGPQGGAEPADQGGDVLLGRGRGVGVPQDLDDTAHGNQRGPFEGEQLQQRPGLAAADLPVGQLDAVADDAEDAGEPQLDRRRTVPPPHGTLFTRPWRRLASRLARWGAPP